MLACAIKLLCGHEVSIHVRLKKWYLWSKTASEAIPNFFRGGSMPSDPLALYVCQVTHTLSVPRHAAPLLCPCCARVTCSSWLRHCILPSYDVANRVTSIQFLNISLLWPCASTSELHTTTRAAKARTPPIFCNRL